MTDFSKEYQTERVESLIEEFRLQKVRKSLGIQLSGGERRRTEIARAVAINPAFILLDEPFSQIAPLHVATLQTLIRQEKATKGILLTDHMYRHVTGIADRLYVMADGQAYPCENDEDLVRRGYLNHL